MQIPESFAEARPHLLARPVGRTPLGVRALHVSLDAPGAELDAVAPVAADVLVGLVLDLPDADVPVTESTLRQWGVTLEQALAESFQVHGGEHPRIDRTDGVILVDDRSFSAHLLRTPSAAAQLVGRGTPVAFVPTDRHVVLGVQEDTASLAAAARVAARVTEDGRPVSASALTVSAGAWTAFELPASAEPSASDLRRRFSALVYALQKPHLQAFYNRSGREYFVATAMLVARPDGTDLQVVATLTEGVATVLPWADRVSLVRGEAVLGYVPMSSLATSEGTLVALADLDPPRWYATRFPSELVG